MNGTLDGNGRLGRLLITFMLCEKGILRRPLLYLSLLFKQNRQEYYDRLMAVRTQGDFEGWIKFFLRGVAEVSAQATDTARAILALREQHRGVLDSSGLVTPNSLTLLERLYEHPMLTVSKVAELLDVTFPTANNIVGQFQRLGLLEEVTGRQRRRLFAYQPYIQIFHHAGEGIMA
jgi:Fic family protein